MQKNSLGIFFKHKCLGPTIQVSWFNKTGVDHRQCVFSKLNPYQLILSTASTTTLNIRTKNKQTQRLAFRHLRKSLQPSARHINATTNDPIVKTNNTGVSLGYTLSHPIRHPRPWLYLQNTSQYVQFLVQAVISPPTLLLFSWRLAWCQTHDIC